MYDVWIPPGKIERWKIERGCAWLVKDVGFH